MGKKHVGKELEYGNCVLSYENYKRLTWKGYKAAVTYFYKAQYRESKDFDEGIEYVDLISGRLGSMWSSNCDFFGCDQDHGSSFKLQEVELEHVPIRQKLCDKCFSAPEYSFACQKCPTAVRKKFTNGLLFKVAPNNQLEPCAECESTEFVRSHGPVSFVLHDIMCDGKPTRIEIIRSVSVCENPKHGKKHLPWNGIEELQVDKTRHMTRRLLHALANHSFSQYPTVRYISEGYAISKSLIEKEREKWARSVEREQAKAFLEKYVGKVPMQERECIGTSKMFLKQTEYIAFATFESVGERSYIPCIINIYREEDIQRLERIEGGDIDVCNLPSMAMDEVLLEKFSLEYCCSKRKSGSLLDFYILTLVLKYLRYCNFWQGKSIDAIDFLLQELVLQSLEFNQKTQVGQVLMPICGCLRALVEQYLGGSIVEKCLLDLITDIENELTRISKSVWYVDNAWFEESVMNFSGFSGDDAQGDLEELQYLIEQYVELTDDDWRDTLLFLNPLSLPCRYAENMDGLAVSRFNADASVKAQAVNKNGLPLKCLRCFMLDLVDSYGPGFPNQNKPRYMSLCNRVVFVNSEGVNCIDPLCGFEQCIMVDFVKDKRTDEFYESEFFET